MVLPELNASSEEFIAVEKAAAVLLTQVTGLIRDEHGSDTPRRFANMLQELTAHSQCDRSCIKMRTFDAQGIDEMIVIQAIPFVSVCNHHVIPFIGHAHIAYVPKRKLAGLSKFARVVEHYARQLQVQERLTMQVADFLEGALQPRGVGVVAKAEHMCMTIRGIQKPGTYTTTAAMRGVFADHDRTAKQEFLKHVNSNGVH